MKIGRHGYVAAEKARAADGMARYAMTVAYDGTAYAGWQIQPHHRSIQGELERAIRDITGFRVRIHASGRTDAGVHARGQVAHVDLPDATDAGRLFKGLNARIESDIRVLDLDPVPADFHARYSATGKEYRYGIWNAPIMPPHVRLYRTHVRAPRLAVEAMAEAARQLVGRHDFAAFSANPNREIEGTVRTLFALDVRRAGSAIDIMARGDGFLYKMVRSLAGYLIRVGRGEVPPAQARAILTSRVRTARVPTARPQGLSLWKVYYAPR